MFYGDGQHMYLKPTFRIHPKTRGKLSGVRFCHLFQSFSCIKGLTLAFILIEGANSLEIMQHQSLMVN